MSKAAAGDAGRVNQTQAVRAYLTEHPTADSKAVIAALAAKGVKVAPTMVYYVRSRLRKAQRQDKRARVAASPGHAAARNPVELVQRVKELAREVGGMAHLKQLVDLLAE